MLWCTFFLRGRLWWVLNQRYVNCIRIMLACFVISLYLRDVRALLMFTVAFKFYCAVEVAKLSDC